MRPGIDEGILGDLVGIGVIATHPPQEAADRRLIPVHDAGEGLIRSRPGRRDQRGVVGGLHGQSFLRRRENRPLKRNATARTPRIMEMKYISRVAPPSSPA